MNRKWIAAFELLSATSIWGFGFTASVWALTAFDPVSISVLRFGIAFLIGATIILVIPSWRHGLSRWNLRFSFIPGTMLGLALCLQAWGLETTTATKSGFITTLYVVMVPLLEAVFFRTLMTRKLLAWVVVSLLGTALMVQLDFAHFNRGDLFTMGCALTSAIQIISIGRVSKNIKSIFGFNTMQCFWAIFISLIFWPLYGHYRIQQPSIYALGGLFSLTILSTLVGFALQVKAQKVLSSSTSSLIFLLESPFAAVFAVIFLHERLTLWQGVGGLLISVSAFEATRIANTSHEPALK